MIPGNIVNAPQEGKLEDGIVNDITGLPIGPFINPDSIQTGIFITSDFNVENHKEILETMGILLNGEYRENLLTREVYEYVEKYTRTAGFAGEGLYCYNFCLNTDPHEYQPSGAINMSKFKTVELEINTYVPQIDNLNSNYQITCLDNGVVIGTNSSSWRLYEYNYNLVLFEERYNVLSFVGGYCGLMYAR